MSDAKKLLNDLSRIRKEITVLRTELNSLNDNKEKWYEEKENCSKSIIQLISNIKSLKRERDVFTNKVKTLKAERQKLNDLIKTMDPSVDDISESILKARQYNEAKRVAHEQLQNVERCLETAEEVYADVTVPA